MRKSKIKYLFVVLFFSSLCCFAKEEKEEDKKYSLSSSLNLSHAYKDSLDPFLSPAFSFSYRFNPSFSLSASQSFKYAFYVYPGVSALTINNPSFVFSYKKKLELAYGLKFSGLQASFTLPFSEYARINGLLTQISLSSSVSKSFLKKLSLSLGSSFVYFLNQYTTTVTEVSKGGGRVLTKMRGGLSFSLRYKLQKALNITSSLGLGASYFEKTKYTNERRDYKDFDTHPLNHYLSFRLGLSYSYKKINFLLAHSHGQAIEQYGGLYWYLYDPESSRFILSVSASY